MMCEPRTKEESEKYRQIFLAGHTDCEYPKQHYREKR